MSNNLTPKDNPILSVFNIEDVNARENFKNLNEYFRDQNQLLDFNFFDVSFSQAENNRKVPHGLNKAPKDLIRLFLMGPGRITFNRGLFDDTNMDISSSDEVRVRFLAGNYFKDTSLNKDLEKADTESWPDDESQITASSSTNSATSTSTSTEVGSTEEFQLNGGVSIVDDFDGPIVSSSSRIVSKVVASLYNSGLSGNTVITIYYGPTLSSSTTISISANGGLNYTEATPSISLNANDYLSCSVTSLAAGAPKDLRVKIYF